MTKKTRAKARRVLLTLSLVLVVAFAAVGGTIAWLTAQSGNVTNTFAPSTIKIKLEEHVYDNIKGELDKEEIVTDESNYKMVPGSTLPKDPFVTIEAGSESCYVFVKIDEENEVETFLSWKPGTNWKKLDSACKPNSTVVYYVGDEEEIAAVDASKQAMVLEKILFNNQVTVNNVTTDQMNTLYDNEGKPIEKLPKLTFTAYAVQSLNNLTDPAGLWAQATAHPNATLPTPTPAAN